MKPGFAISLCLLLGAAAGLAQADSVSGAVEASMLVTGTVEVNPDGSLHGYTLDRPERLPAPVRDVIGKVMPHWEFTLSAPSGQVVKSNMSLRVQAKPAGDGNYKLSVDGASFGAKEKPSGETVSYKSRKPAPRYPAAALSARVSATVYLLVRVGRDGTVQEAIAEQVNLDQYSSESQMSLLRKQFAEASLSAAKLWTYNLPTEGERMDDPYWVVRVPVNFGLTMGSMAAKEHYGTWHPYVPGPRATPPWISQALLSEAPDATPDDGLDAGNSRLRLKTALGGS
ncbi:energy transducer TonB [Dyella sp. ASV21]|jgi:hypothetical protein|uniref:energy transducer TonB n=1 Tax=Dyella sp. ASV21 TaxID=2795114 RepID=UPI0018EAD496|nr:energy transducer TonB [Dyella sp. ASV21]